jgi:hypothetical protein
MHSEIALEGLPQKTQHSSPGRSAAVVSQIEELLVPSGGAMEANP